jgi:uncharacterized membrane protein YozB (DUF420 family)
MLSTSDLPALNAILNGISMIFLGTGYVLIRRGRWQAHRIAMISALTSSTLFLISYVIYHAQEGSKPYDGEGILRIIYYLILIPHVILAATIVPLVLITLRRALKDPWDKHAKIARITFPLWLYVSITGVIVYLMLYQL